MYNDHRRNTMNHMHIIEILNIMDNKLLDAKLNTYAKIGKVN